MLQPLHVLRSFLKNWQSYSFSVILTQILLFKFLVIENCCFSTCIFVSIILWVNLFCLSTHILSLLIDPSYYFQHSYLIPIYPSLLFNESLRVILVGRDRNFTQSNSYRKVTCLAPATNISCDRTDLS